ncbi:MAG TPA: DUF3857 domain-containing protein [Acidisphaera sp.]|nr:DUF3857 domain-containing protein [Acidisphaera sp.]
MPRSLLILFAWLGCFIPIARAEDALRRDDWRLTVVLNHDLTYVETIEQQYSFLTRAGIPLADRDDLSFYPQSQTLELVRAQVQQPDGSVADVPDEGRFVRPSAADQDAPGFSGAQTMTVLFPQLTAGSRTHVEWRLTQLKPSPLGFNLVVRPLLQWPTRRMTVDITLPADIPLNTSARGGFAVREDSIADGTRHIVAEIDDVAAEQPEGNMVSSADFQPMFVASTLDNPTALGAIYSRGAKDKSEPTPEIAALAARVVGDKTGLAAAEAIHDWIAANIRYVAVFLDPNDGWVPHDAAEVLARGYGDCKDHVALMTAMLAARGIRAEAALVDWGTRYAPSPLQVPQAFNHVIAWLPDLGVFANPTNPYAKLGVLDRRLAGKTVIVATEQGELRRTPDSRPEENQYRVDSALDIRPAGTIAGEASYRMDPAIEAGAREDIADAATPRELAQRMLAATPEGGAGELAASDPKDLAVPLHVRAHWSSPHGVTLQGGMAFFTTPVGIDFEQVGAMLRPYVSDDQPRRHAVLVGSMDLGWRYAIHLPEGYALVRTPPDVNFVDAAGSYTAHYARDEAGLTVTRELVVSRDVFPAEQYPALEALCFAALDDARAVMVMAQTPVRQAMGSAPDAVR